MPKIIPPETRQEALRLRTEEHLGLKDIAAHLGVSKGTVSRWLRDYPLPREEVLERQRKNARRVAKGRRKPRGGEKHWITQATQGRTYSTNEKAMIAEAAVMHRATVHQLRIYGSPFDGDKVDWVARVPETGTMWKVQVKLVKEHRHGLPVVSLRCRGASGLRTYLPGEFDLLVGYDLRTDTAYVWTWDEVAHLKACVTTCPEAEERWDKFRGSGGLTPTPSEGHEAAGTLSGR